MLREIRLGGILGRRFGKLHRIDVKTPNEACRAMSVRAPGFEKFMLEAHNKGMRFHVFVGEKKAAETNIGEEEIFMPSGSQPITIQPVMMGSKKAGLFQTILGAVMVVVGVVLSPWSGGASLSLAYAGGAMMAGGVMQMLAPQPKGAAIAQDAANAPNYGFGGPVNSTAAGNPIPLPYGLRINGGAIISASITTEDF